jgi:aminotransferase EvaB
MMKVPLNDLNRNELNAEDIKRAMVDVFDSGNWIHGTQHREFQNELSIYLDSKHVLGVASGTDALEIAMRAIGCVAGSKVITVANAGGYTSIAAAAIGCEIIYCDVDCEKLLIDPAKLKPLLSKEIQVVVVTHLFGNVAPVNEIVKMCAEFGIRVIEDCAQAIGGLEYGRRVGSIGDIGTFSFYPTKNLGAVGDGGALSTNDDELAESISRLRQYGWSTKYKIDFQGGMNSRLDELQAAVLRVGLLSLDTRNEKRREIVSSYSSALEGSNIKLVTKFDFGNVAHLAVLLLPNELPRDVFRNYLKEMGVQTDVHYPVLDTEQIGLRTSNVNISLQNSLSANNRIVSIPLFPGLLSEEVEHVSWGLKNHPTNF